MKLLMYSICDKCTDYLFPFQAYSDPAAMRNFGVDINNNPVCKAHPADFDLFCVGEFDSSSGTIEAFVPNRFVCSGISVFKENNSNVSE